MVRSALSKVAWVGRTASMVFGLAVVFALLFGVVSMALGANGNPWILGKTNVATAITKLGGAGGVNGAMLQVTNNDAGTNDTALGLGVQAGEPPMRVNSATKVAKLNADRIDGKDITQIGVNGLQRVEVESSTNSSSPKQITAPCPEGKVLVGTGFDVFGGKGGSSNQFTHVIMDFVIPGSASVTVAAYEDGALPSDATWRVKAIAICATAGST